MWIQAVYYSQRLYDFYPHFIQMILVFLYANFISFFIPHLEHTLCVYSIQFCIIFKELTGCVSLDFKSSLRYSTDPMGRVLSSQSSLTHLTFPNRISLNWMLNRTFILVSAKWIIGCKMFIHSSIKVVKLCQTKMQFLSNSHYERFN